jgi:hypothetical protein
MTATDWIVVVGGIAAIAWVNWYFFLAERGTAATMPDNARVNEEAAK